MPTWKLTIEYDGTRYRGWQAQKNTERTVQGMLLRAGEELLGEKVSAGGAGRTDAGVHALAQVAHLRCRRVLPAAAMEAGLNDRLPHDVHVLSAEEALAGFHARHDAAARVYLYRISRRRSAFEKRYVWWVRDRLDARRMAAAAGLFTGRRDFASFAENAEGLDSTIVVVEESGVAEQGDEIHYRIRASHFLWKMVRRLVGTLVEVGRGNLQSGDVERLLREKSGEPARWTAPPSGLFLERVIYASLKEPPPRIRSRA